MYGMELKAEEIRLTTESSTHVKIADADRPVEGDSGEQNSVLPDLGERYEVLSRIGCGGMATVYKILDKSLGKVFAAKVMKREVAGDVNAIRRFSSEVEAASSMTHGNIASFYSHGVTTENLPFLCMDYLEGETLSQLLEREQKLEPRRAVALFQQICEALTHAHMKGIVHRDLKPSNIFITKTADGVEVVKLVDFGIAKHQYGDHDSTRLTQTGDLIGSPYYMSPEQCKGEEQDSRSDIYSLGCVMYQVVSGKPPFAASNPVKVVLQHVKERPQPFREILADDLNYIQALEACVLKCLEKDPGQRYQRVEELLVQLQSLDSKMPVRVSESVVKPGPWRRAGASICDAVVLTFIMYVLGYFFLPAALKPATLLAHYPVWQLDLLRTYVSVTAPILPGLMWVFILGALIFPAQFLFLPILAMNIDFFGSYGACILMPYVPFVYLGYCVLSEASPLQGTLGQRLFGLNVVNAHGGRISLKAAVIRHLMKWVGLFFFFRGLALTPIPTEHKSHFRNVLSMLWRLITYQGGDAVAGAYEVCVHKGPVVVATDKYVPEAWQSPAKLKAVWRGWKRFTGIGELVIVALAMLFIAGALVQVVGQGTACFFLPFLVFACAAPYLFIPRRIDRLVRKDQSARTEAKD